MTHERSTRTERERLMNARAWATFAGIVLVILTYVGVGMYQGTTGAPAPEHLTEFLVLDRHATRHPRFHFSATYMPDGTNVMVYGGWEDNEYHIDYLNVAERQGESWVALWSEVLHWGPWFPIASKPQLTIIEYGPIPPEARDEVYRRMTARYVEGREGRENIHPDDMIYAALSSSGRHKWPWQPDWGGITLNVLSLLLAITFVHSLVLGTFLSHRQYRRSRDLCPFCAYSMADHAGGPCPECGKSDAEPA